MAVLNALTTTGAAAALAVAIYFGAGSPETPVGTPVGTSSYAEAGLQTGQFAVAERPRQTVDIPRLAQTKHTLRVPAGGDLQEALDNAKPGDTIALEPGATYHGPFRLRRKDGDQWIVIAAPDARGLPSSGTRVTPAHARLMPKIVAAAGDAVIISEPGAHHYRFVGAEIAPTSGVFLNALMELGKGETRVEDQPHHIIVERSYLHGDSIRGTRRGVAMNGRFMAVVDSHLSDLKEVGADSQAISGWNGAGPFRIANNYLEAAGENVMFGGADPSVPNLVPSDIEIVNNHIAKPMRWKTGEDTLEGTPWTVKNLFELKNARRVLVSGNLLERNWPHGQNGFAILFTVRNQDGDAPWSVVEDVIFENNLVRHVAAGFNILGRDDNNRSEQTRRIMIRNNLFVDVGSAWGGNGRLFQLLDGTSGVTIDHNTAFQTGDILYGGDRTPHTAFVFQNNVVQDEGHGIVGSSSAPGLASVNRYFPGSTIRRNAIVGGKREHYPTDNFFPASLAEMGIASGEMGIPRVTLARAYARAGTDGRDVGADLKVIAKLISGITSALSAVDANRGLGSAVLLGVPGTSRLHLHGVSARRQAQDHPTAAALASGTHRAGRHDRARGVQRGIAHRAAHREPARAGLPLSSD